MNKRGLNLKRIWMKPILNKLLNMFKQQKSWSDLGFIAPKFQKTFKKKVEKSIKKIQKKKVETKLGHFFRVTETSKKIIS